VGSYLTISGNWTGHVDCAIALAYFDSLPCEEIRTLRLSK
jgi:hypothetical protein